MIYYTRTFFKTIQLRYIHVLLVFISPISYGMDDCYLNYQKESSCNDSYPNYVYEKDYITVNYPGFSLYLNCKLRLTTKFSYVLKKDTDNNQRKNKYYIDENIDASCQQYVNFPYKYPYERGHLVASNHMDSNIKTLYYSNMMVNIAPQHNILNSGSWYKTEVYSECYRDINPILVLGGIIIDDNSKTDFLTSHGVLIPSYFWKVLVTKDPVTNEDKSMSWIFPNDKTATYTNTNTFIVSMDKIEEIIKSTLPVNKSLKNTEGPVWEIPKNCDKK